MFLYTLLSNGYIYYIHIFALYILSAQNDFILYTQKASMSYKRYNICIYICIIISHENAYKYLVYIC